MNLLINRRVSPEPIAESPEQRAFLKGKMKKKIIAVILFVFIGAAAEWGWAEVANRIVAVVNNEIITSHELDRFIKSLNITDLGRMNQEETQKQLLLQLIDKKLVEAQVKRLGIQISKEEVDRAVARLRNEQGFTRNEDFTAALAKGGLTEGDLRNRLKEQLQRVRLISREIGSKIVVPEQKIKEYFEKNKAKYRKTEGVRLGEIILLNPGKASAEEKDKIKQKAEEIWERLKKGEDFAELARKFSQGSTAAQGGDLGVFALKEIDSNLKATITQLKPGEVSKVLPYPQGWQIVKVIAHQENQDATLAEVKEQIQEVLFQEEVELRFGQWVKQLKSRAIIQVMP
jgi:peptidyl-prolyl cis-trans isomerase SurA